MWRHVKFFNRDKVMVKLLPQEFKAFHKVHKDLVKRCKGPFQAVKRVEEVSYKTQAPIKGQDSSDLSCEFTKNISRRHGGTI